MQPVQDILNRIRWDEHWAGDEFKIGYYDRIENRLSVDAFNEIHFPKGDHFTFEVIDRDGELDSVPYLSPRQGHFPQRRFDLASRTLELYTHRISKFGTGVPSKDALTPTPKLSKTINHGLWNLGAG